MPGSVAPHFLRDYIAASDFCINTMTGEKLHHHGNGNAQKTMEYFACGRAVIETIDPALPVPPWLGANGICVPFEDPNALVKAIDVALDQQDHWEQKALEARTILISTHSWDAVVQSTLGIIDRFQKEHHGSWPR